MSAPEWRVFPDADELVAYLAPALVKLAEAAIVARGAFHLVLAGGSTPRALYRALAARDAGDARWHVWYGDERCLPVDHPERNSVMAEEAWLAHTAIPPENRRPVPAERGAAEGAAAYSLELARAPDFDLVLLGMGEDGHTASLFPDHDWGVDPDSADTLAVYDSPKPPAERVSLSAARLNRSARVWFVVTGSGKRHALRRWAWGESLPIASVSGQLETLGWVDAAAWPADD